MPPTVNYSLVLKQTDVEELASWDDPHTSVKIKGGNEYVATQQNTLEQMEPTILKT